MKINFPSEFPKQHQDTAPGLEYKMNPLPVYEFDSNEKHDKKLKDKVCVITGGDSGIGRAVAVAYAKEGAKLAILYYNEHEDAKKTVELVKRYTNDVLLISGDIGNYEFCKESIKQIIDTYSYINVFVSNAAEEQPNENICDISLEQLHSTFKTNFFGAFYLTQLIVPYLKEGDSIIYTTSVTAYHGHELLIDYSCTKGALTTLTRSLAKSLASKNIRVNAVAPGPIWTPLIVSSFDEEASSKFGNTTPMKRCGQPVEVAESFVFLASNGATYITGETIHVNGGEIVNS